MPETKPTPCAPPPAPPDTAAEEYDLLEATVRIGDVCPLTLGHPLSPILRELGPYRLVRQLGSGGMGIVFEALDRETNELFAVKVMRPTLLSEAEAKLRFFREARAMAAVGHQRVVPVVRVGEESGIPYIVMPLLRGETLETRLRRSSEFAVEEVIRIGTEVAEGLGAAHAQGLVHRDVKPANVFLEEPDDSVRLLDLGIAREVTRDSLLTNSGIVVGTPWYMAPEQARGERPDPRADLFSLGCVLYHLATGERPFEAPTPLAVLGQLESHHPPRPCAVRPSVPVLLSNLIMELLAKRPDDRPASADEVARRLRRITPDEVAATVAFVPVVAPPSDPFEVEDLGESFAGSRVFVLSFLSLLAAAAGVWYFTLR